MKLTIEQELKDLHIMPGEYITLWLRNNKDDVGIQVELRVLADGKPEIFIKDKHLDIVKGFSDWMPMETNY